MAPPDSDFRGKTAVITGGSLGIGRSTSLAFGRAGANVVVNFRSHPQQAEEVVAEIKRAGGNAVAQQADVASYDAVEKLIERAVKEFGRVDIAVSNAAYSDREPFLDADLAGFRRTIDVTMWGAFNLARCAGRQMRSQGNGGAICIVGSPHSFLAIPNSMPYNMAKAAIEHMSKTAAIELAPYRIRVNVIEPGWTDTPGERKFFSEETLRQAGRSIPAGRLGTPDEMAECILFLCDARHEYLTGATLLVDGGISLPWWSDSRKAEK
jgi:glucose 1-dehydrogenase